MHRPWLSLSSLRVGLTLRLKVFSLPSLGVTVRTLMVVDRDSPGAGFVAAAGVYYYVP